MKKKLFICAIACVLLTGCGSKIPTLKNGEEALIEFGSGDKFSVNEIWDEVKLTYGLEVTLDKIDTKILEEEYKDKLSEVEVYIKSIEASVKANYVDKDGNHDEQALLDALSQAGYQSLEEYLKETRLYYLQNLAVEDYAATLVTDKEVKKYYEDEVKGDLTAVHILVTPESESDADLKAAKEKAQKIIDEIKKDVKSGTKVKAAFEKYKDNKDVKYEDLGTFEQGKMVSEFEDATYALKKNAYTTKPVKTSYGYHVILKLDEAKKPALEDKKEDIKSTLASEKISADPDVKINALVELRKKYGVKFHDSEMEDAYNKYVNYQLNSN